MKLFRSLAPLVLAAALLAACGGGGSDAPDIPPPSTPGNFTAFISFGDSLSDAGTYAPAPARFGIQAGKFTTNSASGTVWVENLAAALSLSITPAEVGFDGQSAKCPAALAPNAAPGAARACTAYGQGGSRITDPNGIGHDPNTGLGSLTVPVARQIANHLASPTFGGRFAANDLIMIYAGSNDVFTQFFNFKSQAQAQAAMRQAAADLAALVKTQILAKGGKYVAVLTLSDFSDTPFGHLPTVLPAAAVLTDLSVTFNTELRNQLAGQPVRIIDTFALFKSVAANPAQFGLANITGSACDPAKIAMATSTAIQDGSSLFCDANSLMTSPLQADPNTWLFADSVHPTTGGHKVMSDAFLAQLRAFGWI